MDRLDAAQALRCSSESFETNFELIAMHNAVNEQRVLRGLGPVPMRDIEDAERSALGHSDYADRFSLACLSLIVRDEPPDPE